MVTKVGCFSENIINALNLNMASGTPIYIGDTNIEHIKKRHEYEYEKYYKFLPDIIAQPDYVGLNPKDNSIQLVKEFKISNDYVRVAIKVMQTGTCFVKTMHILSTCNADRYIEKGTLKHLDTN